MTREVCVKTFYYFGCYEPAGPAYCCSTVPHHASRTAADRLDVTLLYLPIQTACELQLMDKSVLWL